MRTTEHTTVTPDNPAQQNWVETVREQVNSLRFGQVQIVVHNGQVVQIEKTEKIRFDQSDER